MKNRATSIVIGTVASLLLIMLIAMIVAPAYADAPSQPHNADAMWIEPATITLNDHTVVGNKFNITVALNMTEDIFAYQIGLRYNRTLLMCTRSAYTGAGTSTYFTGHSTSSPPPVIDTSSIGNGSILGFETCLGVDNITGPHSGTLMWAEFQILNFTLPPSGNITCKFDISTEHIGNSNTWIEDTNLNPLDFSTGDGNLTITPEFYYMLILPIFMTATLATMTLSKRRSLKKLK